MIHRINLHESQFGNGWPERGDFENSRDGSSRSWRSRRWRVPGEVGMMRTMRMITIHTLDTLFWVTNVSYNLPEMLIEIIYCQVTNRRWKIEGELTKIIMKMIYCERICECIMSDYNNNISLF